MKKLFPTAVLASILLSATASAGPWGQGGCGGKFGNPERHLAKMEKMLDLTAEQKAEIQALFEEKAAARPEAKPRFGKQIAELDANASDYEQQLDALADGAAELARQRVLQRAETHQRMTEILTEEQMSEWQAFRAEKREKRQGKGGKGQGGRGEGLQWD
ncbi:protein CpxP [Alteromonadaceae bacterium Bs31]|nr:protein CpxP [Alteromonadaceae bacterium Bs31]